MMAVLKHFLPKTVWTILYDTLVQQTAPYGFKTSTSANYCLSAPDELKNQHIVVRPGAKVICPLAMLPFEALLILLPLLSSEEVTDIPLLLSLE